MADPRRSQQRRTSSCPIRRRSRSGQPSEPEGPPAGPPSGESPGRSTAGSAPGCGPAVLRVSHPGLGAGCVTAATIVATEGGYRRRPPLLQQLHPHTGAAGHEQLQEEALAGQRRRLRAHEVPALRTSPVERLRIRHLLHAEVGNRRDRRAPLGARPPYRRRRRAGRQPRGHNASRRGRVAGRRPSDRPGSGIRIAEGRV